MPVPKKLTEQLDDAMRAIEAIQRSAAAIDNRAEDAENRAAEALGQAEKDREAKERAESKLAATEQRAINAKANAAREIAALRASNQQLAQSDREARDELDRLSFLYADRARLTRATFPTRRFNRPWRISSSSTQRQADPGEPEQPTTLRHLGGEAIRLTLTRLMAKPERDYFPSRIFGSTPPSIAGLAVTV
jgi:hypothetical protein